MVHSDDVHEDIEPLAAAKIIRAIVQEEEPALVLCGKQAIDNDMNATGQMLAALLGWSQATFASKLELDGDHALVTREVDGGLQTIRVSMPTVVSVDLRLNEPRYASLPNIMKAKKKPLVEKTAADYGVETTPRLRVIKTAEPPAREAAGVIVGSVDELVSKLRNEAGGNLMAVLLLAEITGGKLGTDATAKAASAAAKLGEITVLCAGAQASEAAEEASKIAGVVKVLCAEHPALGHRLAEPTAALVATLAKDFDHIVAPATTDAKNVLAEGCGADRRHADPGCNRDCRREHLRTPRPSPGMQSRRLRP